MKKIITLVIALLMAFTVIAQTTGKLIGAYWTGTNEMCSVLDLQTKTYSDLDTLFGVQSVTEFSTFDAKNNRYFRVTNLEITVIDALTGAILDTFYNPKKMNGLEYNPNNNKLIGTYWTGAYEMLTSLDLQTKTYSDIDTLFGVQSVTQHGTFDAKHNRYFRVTNLEITVIDALTGAILDTFYNPRHINGLEYNPDNNKLIGTYWTGSYEIFASLDLQTKTYTDIDTLFGVQSVVEHSTFDTLNNQYCRITNLEITVIDALTGAILDTFYNPKHMNGLEYIYTYIQSDSEILNKKEINLYPNPATKNLQLNLFQEAEIKILTILGKEIIKSAVAAGETTIDISALARGMYLIIATTDKEIITRKFIKE